MKRDKIHFIGIGGIGVSALAQYYLAKNYEVSGSDLVASEITEYLRKKGVKFLKPRNPDLIIFSPAVKQDNPELKSFKEAGIKCQTYPEALRELTKQYYTIAISGAHGKSTTTAMIALILIKAGLDPTVIVGTKVKEFDNPALSHVEGSNFRAGKSRFLVIEACEYDDSFLRYLPKITVVTNVDREHLDYFKTFANVKRAFKDFILKLPAGGFLVFNKDDKYIPKISKPQFKAKGYSIKQKEAAKLKKILRVPGMHNVSNALAALEVARLLKVLDKISFSALSKFKGTWRRFEVKSGKAGSKKIIVVSDYGHHPNEISATLKASREKYPSKRIWCVFQPHQHQRTYYLFNDFIKVFRSLPIDNIIITDIYDVAGRETKTINKEVSSQKLVEKINKKNILYLPLRDIERHVKKNIKSGDVLIIMGAGDIYKLAERFRTARL